MAYKEILKIIIPKSLLNLRHFFFAWYGAFKYKNPSEEMVVIGITGTSGKSSTAYILRQLLEAAGFVVGSLSTIDFYIAGKQQLNDKKMTMLGKMEVQRYLRQMVDAGCKIAIIEATSEGAVQHRHKFINFDLLLLTNFYPEHIESHGSFENYKKAKLSIFKYVASSKRKVFDGKKITKTCLVNKDVREWSEFSNFNFENKEYFSATDVGGEELTKDGLSFSFSGARFYAGIHGHHNVMNLLLALKTCVLLNVDVNKLVTTVTTIKSIPGRMEFIVEAKEKGFEVVVDYAFEPVALGELYKMVKKLEPNRIIHVSGNTGGGRDAPVEKAKLIGQRADIVIITNEDPYYDDPMKIINMMADMVKKEGKEDEKSLYRILDRKEGIKKALTLARAGDVVLVTGKGSEQAMATKDRLVPWDDRRVVREVLSQL